ncbi:MAG: IMPACT family protein [Chitinophagales bacterium]|jgi:uncharacterized YigZ family protein|nr:YigZ family protein [Sphingobacteriales bacterium]
MTIKTIDKSYQSEYKSSQSRFIGYLYPANSISIFKEQLILLKKEHSKATHICYAYRIGFQNEDVRANDDGEPSGTAGKPILNQLYSFQVQNVSLFVVRYYGGTKLGVSGLIEAYKEAAIFCLQEAELIEIEETIVFDLILNPEKYYEVIKVLKYNKINVLSSSIEVGKYHMKLLVPISKIDMIKTIVS